MGENALPQSDVGATRPETERKIPRDIEGYPVVTEISGEIRPLRP